MTAGTRIVRTIVASSSTATASPKPIRWKVECNGDTDHLAGGQVLFRDRVDVVRHGLRTGDKRLEPRGLADRIDGFTEDLSVIGCCISVLPSEGYG